MASDDGDIGNMMKYDAPQLPKVSRFVLIAE